ncbi:hypothetical protein QAD02_006870 [Eretmocerus hayati]|uniref:Uncharacterized protein n=1 Tax=Eretmocerus hayati TaxID=131215 RepID=A0ACC2N3B6_9HYME|nr:hypothetical protein QAD02_006870 [Eretmocerus hayati]
MDPNLKSEGKSKHTNAYAQMEIVASQETYIMDGSAVLVPVEIEELDVASLDRMNLNMGEFIEAEAIPIHKIPEKVVSSGKHINDAHKIAQAEQVTDHDDQNTLSAQEEFALTQKFLNGELTFSEFTVRMDQDIEIQVEEAEARNISQSGTTSEANNQVSVQPIEKVTKSRTRRSKKSLPAELQGLMGEANLRYARGEVELATKMCMVIISRVPDAPEPYQTLSMIYENDQPDKSLQFALIAAHLNPRDCEQWVTLANSSLELGDLRQALTCYSKAIQASPKNIELYETRATLQHQNGDRKAFIRAYASLLRHLGPEDGANIMKYARLLAQQCIPENMHALALEGMENLFRKCPQLVTLEEVNIITELSITMKHFNRCLDILIKHTPIVIEYPNQENAEPKDTDSSSGTVITSVRIPDDLPVDLKAKCLICLIELNQMSIIDSLVEKFKVLENPEVSGDLFLDIAESFMGKKQFNKALNLLEPLVHSQNFSLAAVWLRHAECWWGCHDFNKAIKSYEIVRKLSPQHLEARMELAKLYKLKGQFNKAIQVLKQDPEIDILDPGVIYERTKILLKVKRYSEYFESGLLLLSRHCIMLRSKLELTALSRTSGVKQRVEILQRDRLSRGEPILDENVPTFSNKNEPTEKEEFNLILQMCRLACKLKKYGLLQRISFTALTSKKFTSENAQIMYLCLISCIRNNDSYHGFNVVREFVRSRKKSKTWNLLNAIIQRAEDSRHNRFLMRQLAKEDAFSYLHILHANNCLVSGTYKYALNDYVSLFKVKPSPLLALLVSVTLLQMACQKFTAKKNQLVAQAISFMKAYANLRGNGACQESNYNMGRLLHQLGLLTGAVHYYKQVLETPVSEIIEKNSEMLDLKKEAAFNLHLIYMQSENPQLARMYLENYITV